ncbi:hypothetical protein ACFX13_012066 [Malus domestica]
MASFGFSTIFARASAPINSWISCNMRFNAITLICILLFIGAVRKSAQIGLHTWSPDAMEGPTPVSASIHAATMVTAGVFMIARCSPLFEYPPTALIVITFAGATTSFLAATTGILQNDLKRASVRPIHDWAMTVLARLKMDGLFGNPFATSWTFILCSVVFQLPYLDKKGYRSSVVTFTKVESDLRLSIAVGLPMSLALSFLRFQFSEMHMSWIPKPNKPGPITPCKKDLIVMEALSLLLNIVYEDVLLTHSHGFRKGRRPITFFAHVDSWGTVDRFFKADIGSPLYLVLMNSFLHQLDVKVQDFMSKEARIRYVRYADDILFAIKKGANSETVSQGFKQFFNEVLTKLKLEATSFELVRGISKPCSTLVLGVLI